MREFRDRSAGACVYSRDGGTPEHASIPGSAVDPGMRLVWHASIPEPVGPEVRLFRGRSPSMRLSRSPLTRACVYSRERHLRRRPGHASIPGSAGHASIPEPVDPGMRHFASSWLNHPGIAIDPTACVYAGDRGPGEPEPSASGAFPGRREANVAMPSSEQAGPVEIGPVPTDPVEHASITTTGVGWLKHASIREPGSVGKAEHASISAAEPRPWRDKSQTRHASISGSAGSAMRQFRDLST